jgi:ArsR family transcriptional regulator, lead/cadmium/zinc/bismuth-responsive transcriptional repressor
MIESTEPACLHAHTSGETLDCKLRDLETAASMCHALSDPARLRLLLWLAQRERCVSELVELEHAKLSSISARLQMLYAARLIARRRDAKHIFYTLADEHVRALLRNVLTHAVEPS